jgi:hypothetical protein|eukprot:COSAG01_NODE_1993_length_8694_cov_3.220826_12_plen_76_part_00
MDYWMKWARIGSWIGTGWLTQLLWHRGDRTCAERRQHRDCQQPLSNNSLHGASNDTGGAGSQSRVQSTVYASCVA